ncbi:MAG: hypothetical protein AAFX99_02380 [Myxococcota bacterium]
MSGLQRETCPTPVRLAGLSHGAWLVWLLGCGTTPSPTPEPTTPPVQPPTKPPAPLAPSIPLELFMGIAQGELPLGDFINPSQGLVTTDVYTPTSDIDQRSGTDGNIKIARRVCGRVLSHHVDQLSQSLTEALSEENDAITCDGLVCHIPGQFESTPDRVFTFRMEGDRPVLESVQQVEQALLEPSAAKDLMDWSAQQVGAMRGGQCNDSDTTINAWYYTICNTSQDSSPGLPLRDSPNWKDTTETLLPGSVMRDGLLLEDLGGRDNDWWFVRVLRTGDTGWVVSTNSDSRSPNQGKPVLCAAGPR